MITIKDNFTRITCDKCKDFDEAPTEIYNEEFFNIGWALHKGRKYIHLCRKCQSKKSREAMDWAKQMFG